MTRQALEAWKGMEDVVAASSSIQHSHTYEQG